MTGMDTGRQVVERALERARRAGADAADALLVESDSMEARVRWWRATPWRRGSGATRSTS
jgi:hypothetical protein